MFFTIPRSKKIYKRRGKFGWRPGKSKARPKSKLAEVPIIPDRDSTSKVKISGIAKEYEQFDSDKMQYDILDLDSVQKVISETAVCKQCHSPLTLSVDKRIGLAFTLILSCTECEKRVVIEIANLLK